MRAIKNLRGRALIPATVSHSDRVTRRRRRLTFEGLPAKYRRSHKTRQGWQAAYQEFKMWPESRLQPVTQCTLVYAQTGGSLNPGSGLWLNIKEVSLLRVIFPLTAACALVL